MSQMLKKKCGCFSVFFHITRLYATKSAPPLSLGGSHSNTKASRQNIHETSRNHPTIHEIQKTIRYFQPAPHLLWQHVLYHKGRGKRHLFVP